MEEKKLELRLGPPGGDHSSSGYKRLLEEDAIEEANSSHNEKLCFQVENPKLLSSTPWLNHTQEEASPASLIPPRTNPSHKRAAVAPVVGWPPVQSFRKNLMTASKPVLKMPADDITQKEGSIIKPESAMNDFFVKINVEGVPIGRKINLNAYSSYDKLSLAIDELFRGLIAAQRETSAGRKTENNTVEANVNMDSVARSGEYTLIYEDNEGDRMLVGDVPWHMFVATVKRLRVLKSSEVSTRRLSNGSNIEKEMTPLISAAAAR